MPERTPAERRRLALRRFMKARELKVADWTRRAGITSSTLYNFLNKESESLSQRTLEKLAAAEGVSISDLIGETAVPVSKGVLQVYIRGAVEAGAWREAVEWPEDDWVPITVPRVDDLPDSSFALLVRGSSMNLEYPDGSYVICVPLLRYDGELKDGEHVVFCRRNREGLVEATVKELRFDSQGRAWLWPRSDDPRHASPIEVPWPPHQEEEAEPNGIEQIEITAVVVGAYRSRRR